MTRVNNKQNIIAIDGPAGVGKSTVARRLAKRLGLIYIDTGAMYRTVALAADRAKIREFTDETMAPLMSKIRISFTDDSRVLLHGEDVAQYIRSARITDLSSKVSAVPVVREGLVALQRKIGAKGGIVMEGRDIGTVVFPNAGCKIFLTASPEERARRRRDQLISMGKEADYDEILRDMKIRDERDRTRKTGPLIQAEDAHLIVTDGYTIDDTIAEIVKIYKASK